MKKAFTLIETLLYLALFSIIFFTVISFTVSVTQSNSRDEYKNAIEKNAIFASEHLAETFTKSTAIDGANSLYSVAHGKIRLVTVTGYKEYFYDNGTLKVTDGTNTFLLNDAFVTISQFSVVPVLNDKDVTVGSQITITFVSKKYPTLNKTIQTYYAFR